MVLVRSTKSRRLPLKSDISKRRVLSWPLLPHSYRANKGCDPSPSNATCDQHIAYPASGWNVSRSEQRQDPREEWLLKRLFEMAETSPSGARALRRRATLPRIVKFELRNHAPKLHLAAVCEPPGLLFHPIVVCTGKVGPAYNWPRSSNCGMACSRSGLPSRLGASSIWIEASSSTEPLSPIAPLLCTSKAKTLHNDMPEHRMYIFR